MKRWLVVLLVVLALVILVSPGLIGMLAERNIEQNVDWALSETDAIEVRTERFDRGWFTSEGQHRILLTGGAAGAPSLLINTTVDHGLIPVGGAGNPTPGLANMLSTFQIDPGDGEPVDLPGTLRSKVGLAGATDSRFLMEKGEFSDENGRIAWNGADIDLHTDWSTGVLILDGDLEPLSITVDGETLSIGKVSLQANQERAAYGFVDGSLNLKLDSVTTDSPGNPASVDGMSFAAEVDIDGDRLHVKSQMAMDKFIIPDMGEANFAFDFAMTNLDAASMQAIVQKLRAAQNSPDPDTAMAQMMPQVQGDVEKLLAAGAGLRIDRFDLSLPMGSLLGDVSIDVPQADDAVNFTWSNAVLRTTASANLRMSSGLFDMLAMMNPDINAVVAMGFVTRDGDDYVMHAEYAKGLLNINGAPMPIPMPAM